jgi:hypothetical protein
VSQFEVMARITPKRQISFDACLPPTPLPLIEQNPQTFRVRFAFDGDAFELQMSDGGDAGENVVVGGANRWK